MLFLSTLSLRRATDWPPVREIVQWISIHALLAESDAFRSPRIALMVDFYPRSPCGERRQDTETGTGPSRFLSTLSLRRATHANRYYVGLHLEFLSTLSLRRATDNGRLLSADHFISIHALLAESDGPHQQHERHLQDFYPRSPCGERPMSGTDFYRSAIISIHALLAESDLLILPGRFTRSAFLSTLSLRRATSPILILGLLPRFLSTLSLRRATA